MTTLFAVCFLVGLGLSVVSFVSGLDRINVFDHMFSHGHHMHALKAGHHHASGRVSAFNAAALTAFLAWFGGTGTVLEQVTRWTEGAVVGAAATAGIIGGSVVNRFLRMLMSREKPLEHTSVVGSIGRVTSPIREGGTGEIVFVVNGTRKVAAARADHGAAIDRGEEVIVMRHDRGIAYVTTWKELGA